MTGLKILVLVEAATLVLTVGLVLHSEGRESFPSSVAVVSAVQAHAVAPVPLSVDLGARGRTVTAALSVERGGQAVAAGRSRSGSVGFRTARVRGSGHLAG